MSELKGAMQSERKAGQPCLLCPTPAPAPGHVSLPSACWTPATLAISSFLENADHTSAFPLACADGEAQAEAQGEDTSPVDPLPETRSRFPAAASVCH